MKRRDYLSGLAGIGAMSAVGTTSATEDRKLSLTTAVSDDTYHPGPPRFGEVGHRFYDEIFTDFVGDDIGGKDRDNFSPQIVGEPQQDPENYSADDFSWSVASAPEGSTAEIEYAPPDGANDEVQQYDSGLHNVAEFAPDVAGVYELELDAPDGTHTQKIHVFPQRSSGAGGPPRISIDGHYDSENSEFVLESNPELAPSSTKARSDIVVEWLTDDRDALSIDDVEIGEGTDSWTARVPKSALGGETGRIHACPTDGARPGYEDTVTLDPETETIEYPTHPPEWIENGIMYEIFPRSFEGPPNSGEWPLYNSNANFKNFEERLDYLQSLNVDVIWFTPVVPAESSNWKPQNADQWDSSGGNRFKYVGGGPHAYDALSYFQIAEDLGSEIGFEEYSDEPWPWEDGYDPENNRREDAREQAMQEFKDFISAAHDHDIKVCFDFVINHCGRHHRMFQDTIDGLRDTRPPDFTYKGVAANNTDSKYFDWFARKDATNTDNSGNLVDPAPAMTGFAGLRVMPQWNYGNVAAREHILAAADYLSDEVGVDAFRCDIAYGVPHSFWREVREVVRANNSEFMMLDETIPNDPDFAENEFGLHFDSVDFMKGAGHSVVNGGDPKVLFDSVEKRLDEGWPDHSYILNATENHDESRLYKIAESGSRADPAKAQRAVWASGVAMPGVPFMYYGQERLISKYGTARYNYDGSNEDYRNNDSDIPHREYMNWDQTDDDHLQFYKDVTQLYKDTEVLKPQYEMVEVFHESEADVLVFGRTGPSDVEDAIVIIHFDPGTAEVDVLPSAGSTDALSGNDIGVDSEGDAQTVEVDTMAVLKTDSVFSVGQTVAQLDEPEGDDNGPGEFTYPTGDAYTEGVFDMNEVTIHDGGDTHQFKVGLAGDLTNPDEFDAGFSLQHLQLYLRDPEAESGATAGREGTNIQFENPYQYRVVADGENGVRVEDSEGTQVATGTFQTNGVEDQIVVEIPRDTLERDINSHELSVLMCGYDPSAPGNVMQVESSAGSSTFGGAENDNAPNVIDTISPQNSAQSSMLGYDTDFIATLKYVPLASPFTAVTPPLQDDTGDNLGPGSYEMATNDDFYDNVFDIESFGVQDNRSSVRFDFDMAALENPFGISGGWSHEFFQIYIRDSAAGSDVPSGTSGRTATNVGFSEPYQYRIVVHAEGLSQIEGPGGEVLTTDVSASVDETTVSITVPKDAITSGGVRDLQVAPLVFPYDGFGNAGVRAFGSSAGDYTIGASNPSSAPRVMDMVTPPAGQPQSDVLQSGDSLQFISLQGGDYREVATANDNTGDNFGAGSLEHPTNNDFYESAWDISEFSVEQNRTRARFEFDMAGEVQNPFPLPRGWSHEYFQIYIRDPDASEDQPTTQSGMEGLNANLAKEYHYRVLVTAESVLRVENANGVRITRDIETEVDGSTISFTVPKSAIGGNPADKEMTVVVCPYDGFTDTYLRDFGEQDSYIIGGDTSSPRVMDMVTPSGTSQEDALTTLGFEALELPMVTPDQLGESGSGDGGDGEEDIVVGNSNNPAASLDDDPLMEDVDGDGEGSIFDALTYYNNRDSEAITSNPTYFDFDGDGESGTLFDAIELYNKLK